MKRALCGKLIFWSSRRLETVLDLKIEALPETLAGNLLQIREQRIPVAGRS